MILKYYIPKDNVVWAGGKFKRWTNIILSSDLNHLNLKKYLYMD